MESKCLFETRGDTKCCESSKMELTRLSTIRERDIIISRCSLPFDLTDHQLHQLWICDKHRNAVGKQWRPRRTCQYPLHVGKKKKIVTRNVVNLEMSKEIDKIYGTRVPIGSRKYMAFLI